MLNSITDIRELDNLYLATIGGIDFYETRQIVRHENGVRSVVGRASDWPVIKLQAEKAELTWLVTSIERARAEQDVSMVEQACRLAAYKDELDDAVAAIGIYKAHIAALEQALSETALPRITPPEAETAEAAFVAAAAPTEFVPMPIPPQVAQLVERLRTPRSERTVDIDGRVACDHPGCDARLKPRGLLNHKRLAHKVRTTDAPTPPLAPLAPVITPIALELGERPWLCATCHESTHVRSIERPAICIRCAVRQANAVFTNGHQVAA
jgi:hypothetical protein